MPGHHGTSRRHASGFRPDLPLRLTASLDPAPEHVDPLDRPCTVAGHVAPLGCSEDRFGVLLDGLVVPEVEQEGYRTPVPLAEQRLDIGGVGRWWRLHPLVPPAGAKALTRLSASALQCPLLGHQHDAKDYLEYG